ncbi:MAG: FAD-containing monooxygenase EthA [Sandaracinus sp.]|nr:FAD-containing monooxygenase EthA [Sandaracinus sp.]
MIREELDVVIIGAGLSGIGAGAHLRTQCPGKRFAILEMRDAIGGTWDLFRYPGIRSDSDMYTLGYQFKPWTQPDAIAEGADIRAYIEETAAEYDLERTIRYRHRVLGLDWSSTEGRWHVQVELTDTGERRTYVSQYVLCCAGYYRYDEGYTPHFEGREDFRGPIVHPQHWPEDLDYDGKRVVIIGSGATAVTLIPSLAERAEHVVMLQRSPGYVVSLPKQGAMINKVRERFGDTAAYTLARGFRMAMGVASFQVIRRFPERARKFFQDQVAEAVGPEFDMAHFTPSYAPWDERLCAVPDGDLFDTIRAGKASVVTDHIDRFVPEGILLKSGEILEADIVITATGLQLQVLGGAGLSLDGVPVNVADKLYYKGAMLEDVPNLGMVFGYTNASWTLKADLILDFFCRAINEADRRGKEVFTPRNTQGAGDGGPFLNLSSGYVKRAQHLMPRQGDRMPWKLYQNYFLDYVLMKLKPLDDGALSFTRRRPKARRAAPKRTETTAPAP